MDDLIKRSDAIKIMACELYAEAQSQGYEVDSIEDFMPEAKAWMNDAPSADRPQDDEYKNFDREALILLIEAQKERIGELLADRPQGEWIYCEDYVGHDGYKCSECGFFVPWCYDVYADSNYIRQYHTCPHCNSRMKGADDE